MPLPTRLLRMLKSSRRSMFAMALGIVPGAASNDSERDWLPTQTPSTQHTDAVLTDVKGTQSDRQLARYARQICASHAEPFQSAHVLQCTRQVPLYVCTCA